MKHLVNITWVALCLLCACQKTPPKPTYGEIKAQRIDSMIKVAEKNIPQLDSMLRQTIEDYNRQNAKVNADKAALRATKGELQKLGDLRLKRDSLQVAFDTQCARIRFLHRKLEELQQKKQPKESAEK